MKNSACHKVTQRITAHRYSFVIVEAVYIMFWGISDSLVEIIVEENLGCNLSLHGTCWYCGICWSG